MARATHIPANKSNPCPVCGVDDGRCRTHADSDLVLCATVGDQHSAPPEWRYTGQSKNPLWGKLYPDNREEWTAQRREEWQREKESKRRQIEAEKRAAQAALPSLQDRHDLLSAKPRSLTSAQNADLLRRGLLQSEINDFLSRGCLWTERGGYGLAAIDPVTELTVGGQVATDNRDPKYKWLLAGQTHLPETGENPLAFWKSPNFDPLRPAKVRFCEGFLKSVVTAIKLWRIDSQVIVIGAAGGQFGDKALARVVKALPACEDYVLYPDAGAIANQAVMLGYQNLRDKLISKPFRIHLEVAWWGQHAKGDLDCDEWNDTETVKIYSWGWFEQLPRRAAHALEEGRIELEKILQKVKSPEKRERRARVEGIQSDRSSIKYVPGELPEYVPDVDLLKLEIDPSQQQTLYKEAYRKGWKHVLNRLTTGAGKTHSFADLRIEDFHRGGDFEEKDGEIQPVSKSLIYFSAQSRLPSTKNLEANFAEMPIRHNGLTADSSKVTPMGKPYRRIAKDGEPILTPSNCHRAEMFQQASTKGLDWANETSSFNPICGSCPFAPRPEEGGRDDCGSNPDGQGYGFRAQRRDAFGGLRPLRMHPQSAGAELPSKRNIAAWDEASLLLANTRRTGTHEEIEKQWGDIEDENPELYVRLKLVREVVRELAHEAPRYGWTAQDIAERLEQDFKWLSFEEWQDITAILAYQSQKPEHQKATDERKRVAELEAALRKNRKQQESKKAEITKRDRKIKGAMMKRQKASGNFIGPQFFPGIFTKKTEQNHAEKIAELQAQLDLDLSDEVKLQSELEQARQEFEAAKKWNRKHYHGGIKSEVDRLQDAPTQTLGALLGILSGHQRGSIRIQESKIQVTVPNQQYRDLTAQIDLNVYLDATANRETLAAKLGVEPNAILEVVGAPVPANNIKRIQVSGFGKAGRNRADSTDERVKRAIAAIQEQHPGEELAIHDHLPKAGVTGAQIRYISNSRGSNDVAGMTVHIHIGTPKPNMGAVQDDYACFESPPFTFEQYYQFICDSELFQDEGRDRANRYPDKDFIHYYLTEETLPFDAEQIEVIALCYDAAPQGQKTLRSVFEALCVVVEKGWKLTQERIAGLAGLTQGYISRWFSERGGWKFWKSLLFGKAPEDLEQYRDQLSDDDKFSVEFLTNLTNEAQDNAEAVVSAVSDVLAAIGTATLERIWPALERSFKCRFLGALLHLHGGIESAG